MKVIRNCANRHVITRSNTICRKAKRRKHPTKVIKAIKECYKPKGQK